MLTSAKTWSGLMLKTQRGGDAGMGRRSDAERRRGRDGGDAGEIIKNYLHPAPCPLPLAPKSDLHLP